MGTPVSRLLDGMSGREFVAYMHYFGVEPWGLADRALQSFAERSEPEQTPEALEAMFDRALGTRR